MAHKKAAGSTSLGRDSQGQRLGVKVGDGAQIGAGEIIVRQRGTGIHAGENVERGRDDTLFAMANGTVKFTKKKAPNFHGRLEPRTYAHVRTHEK